MQVDLIFFQWWLNKFESPHVCHGKLVLMWAGKVYFIALKLPCTVPKPWSVYGTAF